MSLFQPYPYHVTERNDSMSTAKQIFDCHTITSNYACFELLPEAATAPKLLTKLSPLNLEKTLTAKKMLPYMKIMRAKHKLQRQKYAAMY